jgi:hypothetical protein
MNTIAIIWLVIFTISMVGMYITKDKSLKNGERIRITYLPPCRNGYGSKNPYIGMEGIVHDFDGKSFSIMTETSWLVCIKIKTCKFKKI